MADNPAPDEKTAAEKRATRLRELLDEGADLSKTFESKAGEVDRHLEYLDVRSKLASTSRRTSS